MVDGTSVFLGILIGVGIALFVSAVSSVPERDILEPDALGRHIADLLRLKDLAVALAGPLRYYLQLAWLLTQQLVSLAVAYTANLWLGALVRNSALRHSPRNLHRSAWLGPLVVLSILAAALLVMLRWRELSPQRDDGAWSVWQWIAPEEPHPLDQARRSLGAVAAASGSAMQRLQSGPQGAGLAEAFADGTPPLTRFKRQVGVGLACVACSFAGRGFGAGERVERLLSLLRGVGGALLFCLALLHTFELGALAWQARVARLPPSRVTQEAAFRSLERLVAVQHWSCLYRTAVAVLGQPALAEQLALDLWAPLFFLNGATSLAMLSMLTAPFVLCARLLALAPPSYVFWQAVALRLESARSEHWVLLLYLGAVLGLKVLCSVAASLRRVRWWAGLRSLGGAGQEEEEEPASPVHGGKSFVDAPRPRPPPPRSRLLSLLELLADLVVVSATVWPALFALPFLTRSLVSSGLASRGPTKPAVAALLLLPPSLLAVYSHLLDLLEPRHAAPSTGDLGALLEANAWLRGLAAHLAHGRGTRRLRQAAPSPAAGLDELQAKAKAGDLLSHLMLIACGPLPKQLHAPATRLLQLLFTVGGLNEHDASGRLPLHRQPLTAAVQGVLGPLSKQLSEALQQLLLSPAGRRSVAEGVRELAQSVQSQQLESEDEGNRAYLRWLQAALCEGTVEEVCSFLETAYLLRLQGVLRVPGDPARAVQLDLRVSAAATRGTRATGHLPLDLQKALVECVATLATEALGDRKYQVPASSVRCSYVSKGEEAKVRLLVLTVHERETAARDGIVDLELDERLAAVVADGISAGMGTAEEAQERIRAEGIEVHKKPAVKVVSGKEIRLANGEALKVPAPLSDVRSLFSKKRLTQAEKVYYGELSGYTKDTFKVALSTHHARSDVVPLRLVAKLPSLLGGGCAVVYAEDLEVDVVLDENGTLDVGLEWLTPERDELPAGRLGRLRATVSVQQPDKVEVRAARLGVLSDKLEIKAAREPPEFVLSCRGGRLRVVVEVDLEGGTAAAQEGAALPDRVKRNGAGAFLSIKELKLDDAGFELEPKSREHVQRLLAERRGNIVARFAPVGLVLAAVHMVLAQFGRVRAVVIAQLTSAALGVRNIPIVCTEQLKRDHARSMALFDRLALRASRQSRTSSGSTATAEAGG